MPFTMDDRERGYEAKFVHDQDLHFRILARRDKLFARWAAAELSLPPADADALMHTVIAIPDGPGHDKALLQTIGLRLQGRVSAAESALASTLNRCHQQARAELDAPPT